MPKRPIQHRLEDKSRTKFQDVLPEMWVYRDKSKDYGIDGEVELFGQDEKAQGLIFYVQLKATESEKKSIILNVDLEIETLKYYKSLDIPVLLVRYSDFDNSIYVKWINNVDLFFAKEGTNSFRIKLSENDKWHNSIHTEIENYLKKVRQLKSSSFGFPLPISIIIGEDKVNNFSKGILHIQIKRELGGYSDFITIQSNIEKSLIEVYIDNNELKIDVSNLAGYSSHSIDLRDKDGFAKNIAKDILLGIGVSMISLGQIEYCGRIIFENNLELRLLEKKELLEYCMVPLFHSSFFEKTISLYERIIENENFIGLSIISNFHVLLASDTKNAKKNKVIEEFLKNQIKKAEKNKDKQRIGIANYNLGNYYNNRDKFLEAIHHFNLARKFAPMYLHQSYFYSEIASALFRYEKYKCASVFYSKSLAINQDIYTIGLYADSLMFAGEYKKSKEKFDEYVKIAEEPHEEFVLKRIVLNQLLKKYKIQNQISDQIKANDCADIQGIKDDDTINRQLEDALTFDLLSGLAWFNLGIILLGNNNFSQASLCFIISALINNGDIEAWRNATLCILNSNSNFGLLPLTQLGSHPL